MLTYVRANLCCCFVQFVLSLFQLWWQHGEWKVCVFCIYSLRVSSILLWKICNCMLHQRNKEWSSFVMVVNRNGHELHFGSLVQFGAVPAQVFHGHHALPFPASSVCLPIPWPRHASLPCLLSTISHSLIAAYTSLLHLYQQLPTQRQCCGLPCHTSLSEGVTTRGGERGKREVWFVSEEMEEGNTLHPGNGQACREHRRGECVTFTKQLCRRCTELSWTIKLWIMPVFSS